MQRMTRRRMQRRGVQDEVARRRRDATLERKRLSQPAAIEQREVRHGSVDAGDEQSVRSDDGRVWQVATPAAIGSRFLVCGLGEVADVSLCGQSRLALRCVPRPQFWRTKRGQEEGSGSEEGRQEEGRQEEEVVNFFSWLPGPPRSGPPGRNLVPAR